MTEFLIYDKDHWLESLPLVDVEKKDGQFQEMYRRRLRKGNIIEEQSDGFWDNKGFDRNAFALIRVPELLPNKSKSEEVWKRRFNIIILKEEIGKYDFQLVLQSKSVSGFDAPIKDTFLKMHGCSFVASGLNYDVVFAPPQIEQQHIWATTKMMLKYGSDLKTAELLGNEGKFTITIPIVDKVAQKTLSLKYLDPNESWAILKTNIENHATPFNKVIRRRRWSIMPLAKEETISSAKFYARLKDAFDE